jgi:DNA-binding response OmpR family regulator/anti-anti-sigma regulatory factor
LLIVDDDTAGLMALYETLVTAGFEVIVASNGEMTLDLVRGELPDLILLDMQMPGIDGLETCRRLKADPASSEVPVIFITAHDSVQYRIQTFHVGGVDYICKPFLAAELLARVQVQLSVRSLTKVLRDQNACLHDEICERTAAQAECEQLTQELLQRTEELRVAKEGLERELAERQGTEAEQAELQAQIIVAQQERLIEMSTPLIPITDRIVVMPLIGAMDAERAQQAMQTALRGVASRGADFVILDITGVRAVDASVAAMLVQTSNGLRLLGASALVTGISPDVAQVLVDLDSAFGSLVTKGTLQDGFAYAMKALSIRP